ncbi:MAG: bifunctional riboflavin kinase/FAD synthetase [Actinomycetota bacterium]
MKITELQNATRRPRKIAVGEFDGVHLGHREVIKGCDTVLTFEPHPLTVTRPEAAPLLLTSLQVKADLLSEIGVAELVLIPFDDSFAHQTPSEFIDHVLLGALEATDLCVGDDFRFGYQASGNAATLQARSEFSTRVVPLVEIENEIVSSTHIRALVAAGEVSHAERFLGYPFRLSGPVVHGEKRGRTLGFPTANLTPADGLICPGSGVYACLARLAGSDGPPIPAAVSIGVRPQFDSALGVIVEAFLIDWSGDIYGHDLELHFLARLRGERRFPGVEDLLDQMRRDVEDTRAVVASSDTVSGR